MKINLQSLDLSDSTLRAMQSLTNRQQTCFILHFVYGYKYKEIAKELKISAGNARIIIYRAKKLLRSVTKHPQTYTYSEGGIFRHTNKKRGFNRAIKLDFNNPKYQRLIADRELPPLSAKRDAHD